MLEVLQQPRSDWTESAKTVPSEVLVFMIRQLDESDSGLVGALFSELSTSIARIARKWAKGFSRVTTEDIILAVEIQIIERVLAPAPTRRSEMLEVAFECVVKGRTLNEVVAYKNRPKSLTIAPQTPSASDEAVEESAGPLDILVALEDEARRPELIRRAFDAVKDKRHVEAVVLRYVEGWPLTDKDPNAPSLARHFGMSGRQIQNWITNALDIMRAEIGDSI